VVLATGAAVSDTIDVIAFSAISYQDAVRKSGDTMTGTLVVPGLTNSGNATIAGNLTVSGALILPANGLNVGSVQLITDSSGNMGIGTSSPIEALTVFRGSGESVIGIRNTGTASSWLTLSPGSAGAAYIHNISSTAPTVFTTNSIERMRIDSSGNALIGTTTAVGRITSKTSTTDNTTYPLYMQNSVASTVAFFRSDGNFNTGTLSNSPYNNTTGAAANMYVSSSGDVLRSTSSLRYKDNIQDATHGLAEVLKILPVVYNSKNDGDTIFGGFIAEEIAAIGLKEFVVYDTDGKPDALHYSHMVSLMAKAIQELSAKNDALEVRITALENKQ
jgi:hypothetical protein